jgi:hypothetical protein
MLSSTDWALLVTFKKELEDLKALYTHPPKDIIIVKKWMKKRIEEIEQKQDDS